SSSARFLSRQRTAPGDRAGASRTAARGANAGLPVEIPLHAARHHGGVSLWRLAHASVGLVERVRHVEPGRDGGVRGVDLVGAPREARDAGARPLLQDAGARLLLQDAGARPPLHGSGCAGAGGGVRNQRRADGAPHVAEGGRRAGRVPPDSSHARVRVLSAARGGARGAGRDGALAVVEAAARTAGGRWAARLRTLPGRRTHLVDAHGCTGCLTELGKPGNRSLRSSGSALLEIRDYICETEILPPSKVTRVYTTAKPMRS